MKPELPVNEPVDITRSGYRLEEWTIRPESCSVSRDGDQRRLEPRVMDLLVYLCERPQTVLSKDELLASVWQGAFVKEVALSRAISAIRRRLDDDARHPRLIETIPKRGYRLIGRVSAQIDSTASGSGPDSPEPAPELEPPSPTGRPRPFNGSWWMLLSAILGLVVWGVVDGSDSSSIMVLPLSVLSDDPDLHYLAEGLTEEIRGRLASVPELAVISGTTSKQYRDSELPAPALAERLGVDRLLEGSIQRQEERLTVHLRLVDSSADRQLWADRWTLEAAELFSFQGIIAQRVARALEHPTDAPPDDPQPATSTKISAYDLYLRARGHYRRFNATDNRRAIELFEQALSAEADDRPFPLAMAGLAGAYALEVANFGGDPKLAEQAESLARRAVELAPELPEAHKALGLALSQLQRPRQALESYRKALELRPDYDEAIHNTAFLLYQLGSWDEAGRWQPSPSRHQRPLM